MSIFSASEIESSISLATLDSTQEGGERKSRESGVFIQGRRGGEGGRIFEGGDYFKYSTKEGRLFQGGPVGRLLFQEIRYP